MAHSYDIITVGGGIAASALARAMAERGAKVLVLERETQFKDRVPGEGVTPLKGVPHDVPDGLGAHLRCPHSCRS
jgi:flavin-dependent dehydrogenase